MTTANQAPPTPAWVVPYLADFEEVLRVVELADGFVLLPIEVPGPDLARALGAWLSTRGHPAVEREPQTDEDWNEITGWLLTAFPPREGVVMVLGSRQPPEGFFTALRRVNEQRDAIVARLQCPLFWCGPPSFLQGTRKGAPDFWSVRAVERRLLAVAEEAVPAPPAQKERPKDDLLDEARRQGDTKSTGRIALQRARELLGAGNLGEAQALLDETEPILRTIELALHTELLLLQAEIARRRGETDKALAVLDRIRLAQADRALRCRVGLSTGRVYESLGDVFRATVEYARAAEEARLAADPALSALASVRLGALQLRTGPASEAALSLIEEGRALAAKAGDLPVEALATAQLAKGAARIHDRALSERLAQEARELTARAKGQPSVVVPGEREDIESTALGIVVALEEELRELLDLAGSYTTDPDFDGYCFERGPYHCVATLIGGMGETVAMMVTERMIAQWDPTSIVVLGIAAGVDDDLRVGDVYVAPQAALYMQDAKGKPSASGEFTLVPGAPSYRADFGLLKAVRELEFRYPEAYRCWVAEGRADLGALVPDTAAKDRLVRNDLVRNEPRLLADGHVATGPVVGAAAAFSSWIRTHDRNVKALDMESASIVLAVQSRDNPKRTLTIRGISDYADPRMQQIDTMREGSLRRYAIRNAVRLLWTLLDVEALPLQDPLPSRSPVESLAQVSIARLPATGRELFGREEDLAWLDARWEEGVRVASIVAFGGVGKSALVNAWLARMEADGWPGAQRVYGWSFYSQGANRLSSSDEFIDAALRWFGDLDPARGSAWDKGERLAALVRRKRTLLVLDGVEPLQWGPGLQEGKLKDPALEALVKELGAQNNGLCLITSRIALADLDGLGGDRVRAKDLGNLSPEAGARLLKARGAKGTDEELREAAREYKGNGLALTLLGSYLEEVAAGDIRRRKEIGPLEEDERHGGHARRVMAAYEAWLGKPEIAILHMLGLFDRPVEDNEIAALRAEPAVPGLTDALVGVSGRDWNKAVAKLRRAGLLSVEQDKRLDSHPLVREHFGQQLQREQPEAWREGHRRLYVYLKEKAKELPETIEEMAPLYAAVVHGCLAGKNQEAFAEVYWKRIQRGPDHFNTRKLGAFVPEVAVLSPFFDPPWERIAPGLRETDQALVLSEAGFALRALGRLPDAAGLMRLGTEQDIVHQDWRGAAISASNLSELLQARGELNEALAQARTSVEFADTSGDAVQRMINRTTLAAALHTMGLREEAAVLLGEAERMQKARQPASPLLYSVQGFWYCDFLLDQGRDAEVRERATQTLEIATRNHWLLAIALDHLSLGRAHLLAHQRGTAGDLAQATSHLQHAVDGLRRAGVQDMLPLGLLARAALHTHTLAFPAARHDLDAALTLATRCGFRLHEADAHLGHARLALAEGHAAIAREHLAKARRLIEATGYHRRDGELAELGGLLADFMGKRM